MKVLQFVKPPKKANGQGSPENDVRRQIDRLSDHELLKAANAYFARITPDSIQCKKPFSDPATSPTLIRNLGTLLQAADLFRGARVLDFGCATGWLSLGMAQMGCDVIGVDVAPSALKLAERLKARRRVESDGRMEFHAYDGRRLPVGDESVDRIVCYDAFHHVRDQASALKEFARVLRDGGRAAFLEPGPGHSGTIEAQTEMARYKVIENDVSLPSIGEMVSAAGLEVPEVLVQFQRPQRLSFEEFVSWSNKGISGKRAKVLMQTLLNQLTDTQCFYIRKGSERSDSRQFAGLGGKLRMLSLEAEKAGGTPGMAFKVVLCNTGTGQWLTEKVGSGQVRLGIQLLTGDGGVLNLDYARFNLDVASVQSGQEIVVDGVFRLPPQDDYMLRFDLVSEHVAWFAQHGKSTPLDLTSRELKEKAFPGTS